FNSLYWDFCSASNIANDTSGSPATIFQFPLLGFLLCICGLFLVVLPLKVIFGFSSNMYFRLLFGCNLVYKDNRKMVLWLSRIVLSIGY
ncbi:MAG: hypothetical protein K6T73_10030, partial [Candidatus Bathyarchaeota archaeon]|nr:hypothetical protein [Candidatus Bathyarchaeota archaeon]